MFIPHPSATIKVLTLSYISLILLSLAQASIVATYWVPHINGMCICKGLWSAALIFYVTGLYTLKFIYIERVSILNKHPMLGIFPSVHHYISKNMFPTILHNNTIHKTQHLITIFLSLSLSLSVRSSNCMAQSIKIFIIYILYNIMCYDDCNDRW